MRTEIKLDTGSYIKVETVTYHVPCLQACVINGNVRTVTDIKCSLELECEANGNPLHIHIGDLGSAEELYEQLGAFIETHRAKNPAV